jgi:hypothetical protein
VNLMETFLEPADWPFASQVLPLLNTALSRLDLGDRFARVTIVVDDFAADERTWLHIARFSGERSLTIWLNPDQFLHERPKHSVAGTRVMDWEQGAQTDVQPVLSLDDFSHLNAQRTLYQQLLFVRDLLEGRVQPDSLAPESCEAFQEAWLVTIDGRLRRAGLPHLSAAQRRLRFLHVFAFGAVLTPCHWKIFNQLWEGELPDQTSVVAKIHRLPTLRCRLRR